MLQLIRKFNAGDLGLLSLIHIIWVINKTAEMINMPMVNIFQITANENQVMTGSDVDLCVCVFLSMI